MGPGRTSLPGHATGQAVDLGARLFEALLAERPQAGDVRAEFCRAFLKLRDGEAKGWDELLGRLHPKGARLHAIRTRARNLIAVHEAVFRIEQAALARGQWVPINRIMFDEIGERRDISLSGATVERLYYEAVNKHGRLNVAELRGRGVVVT